MVGAIVVVASIGMLDDINVSPVGAQVVAQGGAHGSLCASRRQKQSLDADSHPMSGTAVTTSTTAITVSLFITNFSAQANQSITLRDSSIQSQNRHSASDNRIRLSGNPYGFRPGLPALQIYTTLSDVQIQPLIFLHIYFFFAQRTMFIRCYILTVFRILAASGRRE